MNNFTPEQIKAVEAAYKKCVNVSDREINSLIAELQKPKPVFEVGEVYCHVENDVYYRCKDEFISRPDSVRRHLLPSEVPLWEKDKKALALAIRRLEALANDKNKTAISWIDNWIAFAQTALDDIQKLNET